ncbi:MAG: sigma-70 family RNA polymerase sigma factor [Planctomycetia bacterium]|nr:sigma-70 family RNA polymerase sigma factor [Planctomycetia bacterium]
MTTGSPRCGPVVLPWRGRNRKSIVDMEPDELLREFVRQRHMLYGYVFALTADHNVSEDVLQEIGVSILNERKRGTEPENVLLWLRGLARHRVADHYRHAATRERREMQFEKFADIVDRAFVENATEGGDEHDQLELLKACIKELTERVRTLVELKYGSGKSIEEIASAVSWTSASVKVALSRARRSLADCVGRKSRREEALR